MTAGSEWLGKADAMTKMWKVVYGVPAPVEVEAEKPCYPNVDSAGDQIFDNSHFLSLADAWTRHLAEHVAGFRLAGDAVEARRAGMVKLEQHLLEASLMYNAALKRHAEFEKRRAATA